MTVPGLTDRQSDLFFKAINETFVMVGWSATIAIILGLPLGVLLVVTRPNGLRPFLPVSVALDAVINVGRSLPFIILMVAIIPFTRAVVGTSIGTQAAIVPLAVAAIPFYARLAEASLLEVDHGIVEMIQSTGGTISHVVWKGLIPEAVPSLIRAATVTVISLIGYSAMAGVIGGGGLGDLAYRFGYQRFEANVMLVTIVALVAIVQIVQWAGDWVARAFQH